MKRWLSLFVLFFVLFSFPVTAQSNQTGQNPDNQGNSKNQEEKPDYEPYTVDEFHPALHQIRRSEVLFFGSFPISYFYSNLGYLIYTQRTGNEFSSKERTDILLYSSLTISVAVVLVDLVAGLIWNND